MLLPPPQFLLLSVILILVDPRGFERLSCGFVCLVANNVECLFMCLLVFANFFWRNVHLNLLPPFLIELSFYCRVVSVLYIF